jgi:Leucine-rich repeat (LRR) protein
MAQLLSFPCLLLGLLMLLAFNGPHAYGQATKCPRIYREGSLLRTDSAQSYQWYRNGERIPDATQQSYQPLGASANYSVEVQGRASTPFAFELGPITLIGQAFDEHLRPVANAKIIVGNRNTQTDLLGRFQLTNFKNDSAILIRGEKAGHWTSQRRIMPTGQKTHVQLMLRSQPFEHELSAERGGTISRGPFFLTLQPNGVLNANNQRYTGVVKIALNGGRPDDPNFGWMMPGGDFMAQDAQGRERILYSYGFLSAHLQTPDGQPLKLDPSIGAQLRFVMPHTMVSSAPDSLPLWHFDETDAIWKAEGTARREGAAYICTVRHFSSWNCDVPSERATVRGRVLDCKGRPISQSPIRVGQAMVTTDDNGLYNSFVPSQVGFTVRSTSQNLRDTLSVRPLQPEVVENLSDLQSSGSGLYAYSIIDANNVLTIHSYGTRGSVAYSIDSGATFQTSNSFKTDIKGTYQVIVKDSMDCPTRVNYIRLGQRAACQLLDSAGLNEAKVYSSINDAIVSVNPVYRLNLVAGFLSVFPEPIAIYLPCLQTLNFQLNEMRRLPESIGNLTQLQQLKVERNYLNTIPQSIGNLSQLKLLILSFNRLTSLPESFGNLTQLENLDLSSNQLTKLPESIGNLNQLKMLSMSANKLTGLPESFGSLNQLKMIEMSNNLLRSLPESFGNLTQLQTMYMSANQLTSLPESFSNLTQLQKLWVTSNRLASLPDFIGSLTQLQEFRIDYNQLTIVPEFIGTLTQLKVLGFSYNQLTSLPAFIGNLTLLKELSLSDNQLTRLPDSIGNLTLLEELRLSNNQLTRLPDSIGNLIILSYLDLRDNPIPRAEQERIRRLLPNCRVEF